MRALLLLTMTIGCATASDGNGGGSASGADAEFAALSKRWLDGWMRLNQVAATQNGDHRFDHEIDDLSPEGLRAFTDFSTRMLAELDAIERSGLSRENQVDAAILHNQIRFDIWAIERLQSWAWDPQLYSQLAGGALYTLMAREFAPIEQRLKSATARMEQLPRVFEQMRKNLVLARVPKTHAETVAKQNQGVISIVEELMLPHAGKLSAADRTRFDAAVETVRKTVAEHQKWLDETLVPGAKGEFRLGRELYDQKLAFALNSPLSREEIRRRAEAEIVRVRAEMYEVARGVMRGKPNPPSMPDQPNEAEQQAAIEAALELAYAERPPRDQVVELAKKTLADATSFVRAKGLVTVPDDPVKIILMPVFQRGVAIAYCDSPGPLDKGLDTYYAISPIPDEWTAEQVDSFLREYNTRMLNLLSIHEAMPGHYLEGAHSAHHPSTLRAVLRSGVFAEGWAVYMEDQVADAGYLDNDPLFRLVQLKFYLRAVSNSILDQGVHVEGWSREQAIELMVKKTFQQEREAAGKWVRAQLTSAQLPTYFVGAQEHFDLRKAAEAKLGAEFDVKRYHDDVLSHGAPPVRYVRQLMLGEPIE